MKKNIIALYVNEPMGARWQQNTQAAWKANDELGVEVVVIKKTSREYGMEKDPPPCPSVALNNRFIIQNGTVTYDELKMEILKET